MLLRRLAIAGFFFLLALIVIVFVLENLDSSHVTFLGRQSPEFPLVLLLLSSFVMGGAACSTNESSWLHAHTQHAFWLAYGSGEAKDKSAGSLRAAERLCREGDCSRGVRGGGN